MKFILGTKINMTEYFEEDGKVVPVTVVSVLPSKVLKVKGLEQDGYKAVQLGYEETKPEKVNKAQAKTPYKVIKEFRLEDGDEVEIKEGDTLDVTQFEPGEKIVVSSISKGKGFQGVVKRHGFKGGRRTHGQKHSEREAGSIGATGPQRVLKGTRMAGRMGGDRITQKNLKVVLADKEKNLLLVKGAIAGRRGTLVEIVSI